MNKQKIMQVVTLGLAVGVGVAIFAPLVGWAWAKLRAVTGVNLPA